MGGDVCLHEMGDPTNGSSHRTGRISFCSYAVLLFLIFIWWDDSGKQYISVSPRLRVVNFLLLLWDRGHNRTFLDIESDSTIV
jgi:hypothetical protein